MLHFAFSMQITRRLDRFDREAFRTLGNFDHFIAGTCLILYFAGMTHVD
jgi:hypothetical protein